MAAFTVRLDDEKTRKLDQLASRLDRSRSWLAAQAIDDYLAREEWQIAEIEAGLAEADRGEFASTVSPIGTSYRPTPNSKSHPIG